MCVHLSGLAGAVAHVFPGDLQERHRERPSGPRCPAGHGHGTLKIVEVVQARTATDAVPGSLHTRPARGSPLLLALLSKAEVCLLAIFAPWAHRVIPLTAYGGGPVLLRWYHLHPPPPSPLGRPHSRLGISVHPETLPDRFLAHLEP